MERDALLEIRSAAPEYSQLQLDWEGEPESWRVRIRRDEAGNVVDM